MVSKKTSAQTGGRSPIAEKLVRSAYNHYGTTVITTIEDGKSASGMKRFLAATLLSSSSTLVAGAPANALSVCSPTTPGNNTTVTCVAGTVTSPQEFTANYLTVNTNVGFIADTTGLTAVGESDNVGIRVSGSNGRVTNSGQITTGDMGGYYRHHGIFISGADGYGTNATNGSINTSTIESHGIFVDSTSGGTAAGAINYGTIVTTGPGSAGIRADGPSAGYATVTNAAGATITTSGAYSYAMHATGGTVTGTNTGTIISTAGSGARGMFGYGSVSATLSNYGSITMTGNNTVGVDGRGPTASVTNGAGGMISVTGTRATALSVSDHNSGSGTNNGTLYANGDGARGMFGGGAFYSTGMMLSNTGDITVVGDMTARGSSAAGMETYGPVVSAINTSTGTIMATGAGARGMVVRAVTSRADGTATNAGTITVSGAGAVGIFGSADTGGTLAISNTATVTASGAGSFGIKASGPTVNITNALGATITGAPYAIAVNTTGAVTITNHGTLNGDINEYGIPTGTLMVTNTGTINGHVLVGSGFSTTVVNDGGTIGSGRYATFTGGVGDSVTISGSGNVIKGVFTTADNTGAGNNVINFSQSDTLTLNGGYGSTILSGFSTVNFNSGTTVTTSDRNIVTVSTGTARVNVNAGATFSTTSTTMGIYTNVLTVAGTGGARGTLSVPAGSTINVTGNVVFNSEGRFQPGVDTLTSAGLLTAANITFNTGSEVYADVTSGLQLTAGNAIKVAGATSALTDDGLTVSDNTALFDFEHEVRTGNELFLVVKQDLTATQATDDAGSQIRAEGIAEAIDQFITNLPTNNPIVVYLAQFPLAEQPARLVQLVKDSLPSEAGAGTAISTDLVLDLIMDRLSGGGLAALDGGARPSGLSAGEQILGGAGNWALWGRAGGSFAKFDPANVNGFESDTYAVSLGVDGDITDDVRMGLAFFYSDTHSNETGTGANSEQAIEGYGALLYGSYRPADFYVSATLGFGMNEYDSQRLALGGINRGNFDGTQIMGRAEVGKIFTEGNWDLSPHVGVRVNQVAIEGYTETGPLPTSIDSQHVLSIRGVLGLAGKYTHTMESGSKLIPEGYVRGIREMANPAGSLTGQVVGGGTFISQSVDRDELSYGLGAGITYEMDEQLSVRILYDGEFQEDYQEHSLSAAVRVQF